jgi:hypothetical protein
MSKNELILACTYLKPRFISKIYAAVVEDTNESKKKSDAISNLQNDPKKQD